MSNKKAEIGFIQGRLSPIINGKVQAFPWPYWRNEFPLANQYGFSLMEWTLDQHRLYENPLMTAAGREEIKQLCAEHDITIPSVTGDCFMQSPFFKSRGTQRASLLEDARKVIEACAEMEIGIIVLPLVDHGSLENQVQEEAFFEGLDSLIRDLKVSNIRIAVESDYAPAHLGKFISHLDQAFFGINYDIGNSAAMGFEYQEEFAAYGKRIINVHVKDRVQNGGTVPLGTGAADIPGCLEALLQLGYDGPYILQTARAENGDHAGVLCVYRDMIKTFLEEE